MQANPWADLLTTTSRNQAMRYAPSSPRASPLRSLPQAPRANPGSAPVHTGGDAQQTRVPTHSDRTRTDSTRNDSTRSEHTSSHQMRTATPRPNQRGPCYPQGGQSTANDNPGRRPRLALGANTPCTRRQATRVEEPCKGAPRFFRPAVGKHALSKPERDEAFSPAALCGCPAQRQDGAYLLRQQYLIAEAPPKMAEIW